jgi:hypothetical protein
MAGTDGTAEASPNNEGVHEDEAVPIEQHLGARFDRGIALRILEQAAELGNDLHIAFDQEKQLPPSVENRRERLSAGLRVVAKFVASLVGPKYADPFDELASVQVDLNAGALPELAVPANYGTRRPDPSQTWRARANVVLAIEALIASGQRPSNILAEISTRHPSIMNLAGPKAGNLRVTLSGWRKEFRQNRIKNSEASDLFAIGRKLIEARRGDAAALREIARGRLRAAKRVFSPGV